MAIATSEVGLVDVLDWIAEGRALELRKASGLSVYDAGAVMDVTGSAVSLWERGKRRPRGRNLNAYRRFLADLDARARRRAARTDAA